MYWQPSISVKYLMKLLGSRFSLILSSYDGLFINLSILYSNLSRSKVNSWFPHITILCLYSWTLSQSANFSVSSRVPLTVKSPQWISTSPGSRTKLSVKLWVSDTHQNLILSPDSDGETKFSEGSIFKIFGIKILQLFSNLFRCLYFCY